MSDGKNKRDRTYNFGAFDANQDQLLFRYLNGTLIYSVHMDAYQKDLERYNGIEERWFVAQRLLLPPQSQQRLLALLEEYEDPSRRDFVYHWAKASCATQLRDLIDQSLDGALYAQSQEETTQTYRTEALRQLWNKPWLSFGWNYIAAEYADQPRSQWELMFSPAQFRASLDRSRVRWPDAKVRPLVAYTCTREGKLGFPPAKPPSSMARHSFMGLLIGLPFFISARFSSRHLRRLCGVVLILAGGSIGCLGSLHAALYWSALEGLHPNINQLLCSPIHFTLIPAGWYILQNRPGKSTLFLSLPFFMSLLALMLTVSRISVQQNYSLLTFFCLFYFAAFCTSAYRYRIEKQHQT